MQELGRRSASIAEPHASAEPLSPTMDWAQAALERARSHLLSLQKDDGHWCGELEGDTILESEYLLLLHFLGRGGEERAAKAAEYVRREQLDGGGWAIYPGGPPEVSASVKAYFVLKLAGDDPDAEHMVRSRRVIRGLGGVEATNTYTKTYLAVFGQYDWEGCPAIPPEIVLLPRWFYFDLYEMSSWSRAIFVPLSIIWALKPRCEVPPGAGIEELILDPAALSDPRHPDPPEGEGRVDRWRSFFYTVDRGLKLLERSRLKPLRRRALERAEQWIRERLEMSDGLGAIFPSIVNTVIALRCLGHDADDPLVRRQLAELEALELDRGETLKVQPCLSPVWDTAQAIGALTAAGTPADDPRLVTAAEWLLDHEVHHPGDWREHNPDGPIGGWYFEYANEFYPDCDDTAEVLTALGQVQPPDGETARRLEGGRERALQWLLSMQNDDGGWAAFDKGCDKEILTLIPFADHNAMLDPSCEDITGRVLETLACEGYELSHPVVRRGVGFLLRTQQSDGSWYGRWGTNYIYGTWLALWGLMCAGEEMDAEPYRRAADWLYAHQNDDGGWGESPASYDDPASKGRGPSTAAQTSWALLGLFATGDYSSEAVHHGIGYLTRTQRPDGSWDDEPWTGTGFPQVFYLRYHLYDDYFPLLALAAYLRGPAGRPAGGARGPRALC